MTTTTTTAKLDSKPLTDAEVTAACAPLGTILLARIKAAGLTINGLAKTTDIPRTTLRRQLSHPETMKCDNFFFVAKALGTLPSTIAVEAGWSVRAR